MCADPGGRLLSGIAGSNLAGAGVSVSVVFVVCCQLRSLRRADHSSRGVLLSVVFLSMISKPKQ